MSLQTLLEQLKAAPESTNFTDVIAVIDDYYDYQDCEFTNGVGATAAVNAAGSNVGSCKILAFAQLNELSEAQTLACFGAYYRDDVLGSPEGSDHQNIRNFMKSGWAGVNFKGTALTAK